MLRVGEKNVLWDIESRAQGEWPTAGIARVLYRAASPTGSAEFAVGHVAAVSNGREAA